MRFLLVQELATVLVKEAKDGRLIHHVNGCFSVTNVGPAWVDLDDCALGSFTVIRVESLI